MDMGLCLLSRIRTECRLWTPLCLVASSTTLPQRQRFCTVWCSIFLYCVDYIIETFPHNFIWSELSGEKCQGNPSLAWKHQQGQTQTRYKRHNPRGSHGSRAGGGSKKSSNFISPSACATRDSQSSKSRIQTLQATMIHLWKRNRIEIQTTTHNQHACAAYMNPDRERERGCGCASACICVLRLCMMSKSKLHLSFRPIRAAQRGSLDRYVLLHCFTIQLADVGQFSAKRPCGSILIHLGHVSWWCKRSACPEWLDDRCSWHLSHAKPEQTTAGDLLCWGKDWYLPQRTA